MSNKQEGKKEPNKEEEIGGLIAYLIWTKKYLLFCLDARYIQGDKFVPLLEICEVS